MTTCRSILGTNIFSRFIVAHIPFVRLHAPAIASYVLSQPPLPCAFLSWLISWHLIFRDVATPAAIVPAQIWHKLLWCALMRADLEDFPLSFIGNSCVNTDETEFCLWGGSVVSINVGEESARGTFLMAFTTFYAKRAVSVWIVYRCRLFDRPDGWFITWIKHGLR